MFDIDINNCLNILKYDGCKEISINKKPVWLAQISLNLLNKKHHSVLVGCMSEYTHLKIRVRDHKKISLIWKGGQNEQDIK